MKKGGGAGYEARERTAPKAESLVLEPRLERIEEVVRKRTRSLTVVLDRLEDSFNMAAVLRTCEAMGLQEVHVIEHPEAKFDPHSKVTQGCDKWLDVRIHRDFAACREYLHSRGFEIQVSAMREGAASLFELKFDRRLAFVFGNERHGVSDEVLSGADGVFWIPMRGFSQSLNVSVAVAATVTRAIAWRLERASEDGDLTPEERAELTERFQLLSVKQRKRIYRGQRTP